MRRAITIAAIAIVVAGLAVLGYYYFFGNRAGVTIENGVSGGNPFGASGGDVSQSGTGTDAGGSGTNVSGGTSGTQVAPHLVRITQNMAARGVLVLDATTSPAAASSTASAAAASGASVRYIDRESGNMYSYHLADGTSVRLTNHTAPGVEEAVWVGDGSAAFIRFLTTDADKSEHIDTYELPADGSDGRLLARDLSEVATQGAASLFTLLPSTSGSVGTVSKPDGSASAAVFSSPLSSLDVLFAGTNLFAYTKPSAHVSGYAFSVDRKSGTFAKVAGPYPGLAALPNPAGTEAILSYLSNGSLALALFDMKTHVMTSLPVTTFAEKCVWAPDGQSAYCAVPTSLSGSQNLPDSWYQGTATFSDRIWKIDLVARAATLVANLPDIAKTSIDATSLSIDQNESALVFMNKRDGSLWAYTF